MNRERRHDPPPRVRKRLGGGTFLHEWLRRRADFHAATEQECQFLKEHLFPAGCRAAG